MINIKALRNDLDYKLHESKQMIVVPHNKVDFDAIASAIALSLIADKQKKDSHVVVNDLPHQIERGCKIIMDEAKNDCSIINKDKYRKIHTFDDFQIGDKIEESFFCIHNSYIFHLLVITL